MSDYEYTDHYKVTLDVSPSVPNADYVTLRATREFTDSAPRVFVATEDAPALALAILEAAGCADGLGEYDPGEVRAPVHVAVEKLRQIRDDCTRAAEREAEDAKVREWRKADQEARGVNPEAFPWENLPPNERASWAARYRAAREFFAREEIIPAEILEPRVLAEFDEIRAEHEKTQWTDAEGRIWDTHGTGWAWRSHDSARRHYMKPMSFPWTEVL